MCLSIYFRSLSPTRSSTHTHRRAILLLFFRSIRFRQFALFRYRGITARRHDTFEQALRLYIVAISKFIATFSLVIGMGCMFSMAFALGMHALILSLDSVHIHSPILSLQQATYICALIAQRTMSSAIRRFLSPEYPLDAILSMQTIRLWLSWDARASFPVLSFNCYPQHELF